MCEKRSVGYDIAVHFSKLEIFDFRVCQKFSINLLLWILHLSTYQTYTQISKHLNSNFFLFFIHYKGPTVHFVTILKLSYKKIQSLFPLAVLDWLDLGCLLPVTSFFFMYRPFGIAFEINFFMLESDSRIHSATLI